MITVAEKQLCNIFDKVKQNGMEDEAFIGRGRALEKRMRPVFTPQAGEDGNGILLCEGYR